MVQQRFCYSQPPAPTSAYPSSRFLRIPRLPGHQHRPQAAASASTQQLQLPTRSACRARTPYITTDTTTTVSPSVSHPQRPSPANSTPPPTPPPTPTPSPGSKSSSSSSSSGSSKARSGAPEPQGGGGDGDEPGDRPPPLPKELLQLLVVLIEYGGLVGTAAVVICYFTHIDPFGHMHWDSADVLLGLRLFLPVYLLDALVRGGAASVRGGRSEQGEGATGGGTCV